MERAHAHSTLQTRHLDTNRLRYHKHLSRTEGIALCTSAGRSTDSSDDGWNMLPTIQGKIKDLTFEGKIDHVVSFPGFLENADGALMFRNIRSSALENKGYEMSTLWYRCPKLEPAA